MKLNNDEEITIIDRLSLGLETALTIFITGAILWLCFNWFFFNGTHNIYIPFIIVWSVSIPAFVWGVLTLENHLLTFLKSIKRSLVETISKIHIGRFIDPLNS